MSKGEIEAILKKHTFSTASFLDDTGKSHWYTVIDEIYELTQKEQQVKQTTRPSIAQASTDKKIHIHYDNWGHERIVDGSIESCTDRNCLVVTHQHVEEGSLKIFGKLGSVDKCTDYCKQAGVYTLKDDGTWEVNEKANQELPPEDRVANPWTRDCLFTADMMRTVHTRITGKVLTLIDASVPEPRQNKALKDLIHTAIWQETWNPISKWMQKNVKGLSFPFYHEPVGLDG